MNRSKLKPLYASFSYRAGSWDRKRRVVAKVEWHPGELHPRVGFIVTNLSRPAERVVAMRPKNLKKFRDRSKPSGYVYLNRLIRNYSKINA